MLTAVMGLRDVEAQTPLACSATPFTLGWLSMPANSSAVLTGTDTPGSTLAQGDPADFIYNAGLLGTVENVQGDIVAGLDWLYDNREPNLETNMVGTQLVSWWTQKDGRKTNTVMLEHGKPMIFGADSEKGLRMNGTKLEVIQLGNGVTEDDVLLHDETDRGLAFMLSQLSYPEFPEPLGVIYCSEEQDTYDNVVHKQLRQAIEDRGEGELEKLINEGETWIVEDD